jgi:hypothetical protein
MVKKINYQELSKEEIISEIMKKKEFSDLPKKDVELVYSQFEDEEFVEDRIKKTRELLMKMYTVFVSKKLLSLKDKDADWFLNRHKSTKERFEFYEEVYLRILGGINESFDNDGSCLSYPPSQYLSKISKGIKGKQGVMRKDISKKIMGRQEGEKLRIIDFGCGVNGFSYEYFSKFSFDVDYLGIEPVGQLVDLQNNFFLKKGWNAKCVQASLFDLKEIKEIVKETKTFRIGFFFKVLDSLEMFKKNYSKKVLKKLAPLFDRCVVSWATKSLGDRKKIFATKKWLKEFIENNFKIIDEFEIGGENYLVFENK